MSPLTRRAQIHHAPFLCAALLLCFLLVNCGDYCIVVTGIFPNTSSTTNPPTCPIPGTIGIVTTSIHSIAASSAAPMAPNLAHVLVTIRGIEAHTDAQANENSPGWQELAPDLAIHPLQFDLMDSQVPEANAAFCAPGSIRANHVAAGAYHQIRLRLVPNHPSAAEPIPQHNECAGIGPNCVVANNGRQHALALDGAAQYLVIPPSSIANGFFNVVPDTGTHLSIEFNPYSSLAAPAGDAVRITPVFSIASAPAAAACDSFLPSP